MKFPMGLDPASLHSFPSPPGSLISSLPGQARSSIFYAVLEVTHGLTRQQVLDSCYR